MTEPSWKKMTGDNNRGRPLKHKLDPSRSAIDRLIWYFGGIQEFADHVGVTYQTVTVWRKEGVNSVKRCIELEEKSEGTTTAAEFLQDMRNRISIERSKKT